MKFKLLMLSVILFVFVSVVSAQSSIIYNINGKVVDAETGDVIANAKIILFQDGIQNVIPHYTESDGSFDILGITDVSGSGDLDIRIEKTDYFIKDIRESLPLNGGNVNLGTIYLTSLFPQKIITTQNTIPSYLENFVDDTVKDFDTVIVKRITLDENLMGSKLDFNRVITLQNSNVEYYLVPMVQKLENNQDFVNVKHDSVAEFWKGNKKVDQRTLAYDASRTLRQGYRYYAFKNDNNEFVHFDVSMKEAIQPSNVAGSGKSKVVDGSLVFHNGKLITTNVNEWTCKDSSSAFSSQSSLPAEDLVLLQLEGQGW